MDRYPTPKLAAGIHFFYLENSVKIKPKKLEHEKLPIFWKRLKISQNPKNINLRRYFEVFFKERLLVLNNIDENIFCSKLSAIFKVVKMNFGSKFGA